MVGIRRACFAFFFVSGFCGLLYEVVWTRLAMAAFGVTTTVVSVALSVFMAGLALGAWLAGLESVHRRLRTGSRFLRAYGLVELAIGTGAFCVPYAFDASRRVLLGLGASDSASYHLVSSLLLSASMLPWATLMGTTFALGIATLRADPNTEEREFSFLYLANVLGAAVGTAVTALVLIELLGFRRTLWVAAAANALICVAALMLARDRSLAVPVAAPATSSPNARPALDTGLGGSERVALAVLFATGFVSMALEVVWMRLFGRYLGTFVYTFAGILVSYLLATFVGSRLYRRRAARGRPIAAGRLWAILGMLALVPLALADERLLHLDENLRGGLMILGIGPFCAALGFVTPLVVDVHAGGSARRASRAYAVNVIGCILGPLCAGWILLPAFGERGASAILALVLLAIGAWAVARAAERRTVALPFAACAVVAAVVAWGSRSYAEAIGGARVARDSTATVVAYGEGMNKRLLVNGVGITSLTPITKVMAHLPMAELDHPPRSALAICFGMGTTFRALSSWGVDVTAVDLVPSVPQVFGFFHADADDIRRRNRIVIDDGRRFLDRTRETYDVIAIDPPPPLPAAGSSLLYSREMYRTARRHLAPHGILQQWSPAMEASVVSSITQALRSEFRHVRVFLSIEGWGYHFLASDEPIPSLSAAELSARLPAPARRDLVEWTPDLTAEALLGKLTSHEIDPSTLVRPELAVDELSDDHPTNEYFVVRWLRGRGGFPER